MTTTGKGNTGNHNHGVQLLDELSLELYRLESLEVRLSLDEHFEPQAGTLLKVEIGLSFWHLVPEEFRRILGDIPDGAQSEAIKEAIEKNAMHVWHGPSPKQTRSTSP